MRTADVIAMCALLLALAAFWAIAVVQSKASKQHMVVAPVVYGWWVDECYGQSPGEIVRDDYDTCIDVYQWLSDNEVGPFEEVE